MVKLKFYEVNIGLDSDYYPLAAFRQDCIMLTTRKPTKISIKKGHPVEFAYFPPGEGDWEPVVIGNVKAEDIVELEYKGELTREQALGRFRKAKEEIASHRKNTEKESTRLERYLAKLEKTENKLLEIFPELKGNLS